MALGLLDGHPLGAAHLQREFAGDPGGDRVRIARRTVAGSLRHRGGEVLDPLDHLRARCREEAAADREAIVVLKVPAHHADGHLRGADQHRRTTKPAERHARRRLPTHQLNGRDVAVDVARPGW